MPLSINLATLELPCTVLGSVWVKPYPKAAAFASFPKTLTQVSAGGVNVQPHRGMLTLPTIEVPEGTDITVRSMVTSEDGVPLFASDVDSITLNLFDLTSADKATQVHQEELEVSEVMEASQLRLDGGWRVNTDGYTFKHRLVGNQAMFEGGRTYRAEYIFRTTLQGTVSIICPIRTKALLTGNSQL